MSARDEDAKLLARVGVMLDAVDPVPVEGCPSLSELADRAATAPRAAVLAFPDGYSPSSRYTLWECGANARHNRYVAARITRKIREDTVTLARAQKLPRFTGPVTILVVQHPPKGRRGLDSENVAPLGKAAIDGLRDARVLINDTSKWVPVVSYAVGERTARGKLVLHIRPVDGAL